MSHFSVCSLGKLMHRVPACLGEWYVCLWGAVQKRGHGITVEQRCVWTVSPRQGQQRGRLCWTTTLPGQAWRGQLRGTGWLSLGCAGETPTQWLCIWRGGQWGQWFAREWEPGGGPGRTEQASEEFSVKERGKWGRVWRPLVRFLVVFTWVRWSKGEPSLLTEDKVEGVAQGWELVASRGLAGRKGRDPRPCGWTGDPGPSA